MSKKRAMRMFGGAAGIASVSVALLAVSGIANGVEAPASNPAAVVQHVEAPILVAQAAAAAKLVSYASDQADRGETNFKKYCVECHGDDLRGGLLGGPPLRGLSFEGKYASGAPAGVLFDVMSTTMPPDSPGRFSESTYADLMAYILKRNGFSAGAPLPASSDTLYELTIEK